MNVYSLASLALIDGSDANTKGRMYKALPSPFFTHFCSILNNSVSPLKNIFSCISGIAILFDDLLNLKKFSFGRNSRSLSESLL